MEKEYCKGVDFDNRANLVKINDVSFTQHMLGIYVRT